jgi:hypothetical protein
MKTHHALPIYAPPPSSTGQNATCCQCWQVKPVGAAVENADRRTKGRRRKFGKTPADAGKSSILLARANYQMMASPPLADDDK